MDDFEEIEILATGLADAAKHKDTRRIKEIYSLLKGDGKATETGDIELVDLSGITEPPAQKWILRDLIPEKYPTILYADGGIGKSYLSLHLAVLATMGNQNFLGYEFPDERLNVLFLDWELELNEFARRAIRVSKGLELNNTPSGLYYTQPLKNLKKSMQQIKRIVIEKNIHFVIIDSLGAACVDPEMIDIVELFAALKTLDVAILAIDHQSKLQEGQDYGNKKPYGSAYKFNLSRSALQLSPMERNGNRVTLRLRHKKSNFGKLVADMVFDMNFEADAVRFYESDVKTPEQKEIEILQDIIKQLESEGERSNQKSIKEISPLGRDRTEKLLNKHDGEHWYSEPGKGKEKIYKSENLKNGSYIGQGFRFLENDEESELEKEPVPPEFLNEREI